MSQPWDANLDVDVPLVRQLLATQFPELGGATVELLGAGWDNVAFLLDRAFVLRVPRRDVGAELMRNEIRALPLLKPHLPLAIPAPSHVGVPQEGCPYPFAVYPVILGDTACGIPLTDADRTANASRLGRFLRALHSVPTGGEVAAWAPKDVLAKADLSTRIPDAQARLGACAAHLPQFDLTPLQSRLDDLRGTPPHSAGSVWVHGDLYPRHLLLDGDRHLCGVIDWGDAHLGDPAIDLSIALTFLPPNALRDFDEAYGGAGGDAWRRAEVRAIFYGAVLTDYGTKVGDPALRSVGEQALEWALARAAS